MNSKDLIGLKYPVKDTNENVVGYRTIKKAFNMDTHAGFSISFEDDPTSLTLIGYIEAMKLPNEQTKLNNLPELNEIQNN